jgi:hypothetical protein
VPAERASRRELGISFRHNRPYHLRTSPRGSLHRAPRRCVDREEGESSTASDRRQPRRRDAIGIALICRWSELRGGPGQIVRPRRRFEVLIQLPERLRENVQAAAERIVSKVLAVRQRPGLLERAVSTEIGCATGPGDDAQPGVLRMTVSVGPVFGRGSARHNSCAVDCSPTSRRAQ